jgi:membrane protease subunit HflK
MGLNDNQWGKRGSGGSGGSGGGGGNNQGPPDLDELWRRFNRKLNEVLGNRKQGPREVGGGSGGGFGGGGFSAGQWRNGGLVVGVIVFLVWMSSGIYIVAPAERGVVLRFGKFVEETNPGPRWHLPWPIERAEVVNVSGVRTVEIGYRNNPRNKVLRESLMLTDDENIVDMHFTVQYRIKEGQDGAKDFLFNSRGPTEAVQQSAESAMREVVGRKTMDSVLYESRQEIAEEVRKRMQEMLDRYGTGIQVSAVAIQNAQPPEQVQAAFDDAVRATQDRERQINEGQAYANDVVPKARGLSARVVQEAEGYRSRVVQSAEGDAARFRQVLVEYNRAPAVTRDRMYLETMQTVFTNASKVMVDTRTNNSLLYLPLDKLMQQTIAEVNTAAPRAPGVTPSPEVTTTPAPATTDRSRDGARSRDREPR